MFLGTYLLLTLLFGMHVSQNMEENPLTIPKEIRVGVYGNPPKIFFDEKGVPQGIFIDVIEEIATKEQLDIVYIHGDWHDLMDQLHNGKIDVLPDVAYSAERDSLLQFNSISVLDSWLEIFVSDVRPPPMLSDLANMRVGVLKESIQAIYLDQVLNQKFELDLTPIVYDSYAASVEGLKKEEVDVLLAGRFFQFSNVFDSTLRPSGLVFRPTPLLFAFSNTISPAFISKVDQHISQLKNDPESIYYSSLNHWLDANHTHSYGLPENIRRIIVVVVYLLVIAGIFLLLLQQQINTKTAELKQKNEDLEHAKIKAEESDRLKSVFLQNMSHEIRTPMNGILGFLDLLKDHDLNEETKNEFIDIINQSGQRLLSTVNDIIEISKIESNQVVPNISRVNIGETLRFHERFFKPKAHNKALELELFIQLPHAPAFIESDQNLLDSIFTNLLNNAIKFTHQGGISFGCFMKESMLVFYVKDTGIGILPDRQEAIFQPFVQADLNISRSHEGAGLGLSIVKAYVNLLKGSIWMESEAGKGTAFYVSLPVEVIPEQTKVEQPTISHDPIFAHQTTILIAEDDYVSYLYVKSILKDQPVTLLHASHGREALDLLKKHSSIALVLMDIKMPVMNGLEATKEIRQSHPNLPIIAQTAYAMSEDKTMVLNSGCTDYIAKPINKQELIRLIQKYI